MSEPLPPLGPEWVAMAVGYHSACRRYCIMPAHTARTEGEWNAWRLGKPQATSLSLPSACFASRALAVAACIEDAKTNPDPPGGGRDCASCE